MKLQNILKKLNETMTDNQIAEAIGAKQSVVCRLRNGVQKSTSFERGQEIVRLAKEKGIDLT
jgi:hypothetical protein